MTSKRGTFGKFHFWCPQVPKNSSIEWSGSTLRLGILIYLFEDYGTSSECTRCHKARCMQELYTVHSICLVMSKVKNISQSNFRIGYFLKHGLDLVGFLITGWIFSFKVIGDWNLSSWIVSLHKKRRSCRIFIRSVKGRFPAFPCNFYFILQ